ncbi:MAG: hypothetical protein KH230_09665 [Enterocloster asparagiformis]|nr:hypothetical protein [Enterocloster asparagiformis]
MTDALDFLMGLTEKAKGTVFEPFVSSIFITIGVIAIIKFILVPIGKVIKRLFDYISQRQFIKNKVYVNLSFMESADVYYAINQFIPTRFSSNNDPGYDDEPAPVYVDVAQEKEPLLIERFIKFEFDIKGGRKYYLCLADCGMGKTTFLINLYYRVLKQGKYQCQFISLQNVSCLEQIRKVSKKGETILLLDALDENDNAVTNYNAFITKLEHETQEFYRVVITSRTNFFESESKEHLSEQKRVNGTSSKLSGLRKFYITPFTDEDIQHFLRLRYRFNRKKQTQSWKIISHNKNLSVRPLLLRFIDELLAEEQTFEYDFQLYERLFRKWIAREKKSLGDSNGEGFYDDCQQMAKFMYYQWLKNGKIGVYLNELTENAFVPGIESMQLKGHAMLNRTSDGLYKFSHKSYWEYLLAKLALSDVYFASELLIKNFDRAVIFLEEMIQYYETHEDEQTPETCIGTAFYLMKYRKIEDAEKQCHKIIAMCDDKKHMQLLAMVVLAECLYRQYKYKSEEMVLKDCQILIKEIMLSNESLKLYTQFGITLSNFCKQMHLKTGQEFLQQVIEFCNVNNIQNYSLLRCYESYCSSCSNYNLKQKAMNHMEALIKEHFQNDQYAMYLRDLAQTWKLSYTDQKVYQIMQKIVQSYMRFMDSFEQIIVLCDLGIACATVNSSDSDIWYNIVLERLADAWMICCSIYDESKAMVINSPYSICVYVKVVLAYNKFGFNSSTQEIINRLISYIDRFQLLEEMWVVQIRLLNVIISNVHGSFSQIKKVAHKQLEIAEAYGKDYDLIEACRNLFLVYNSQDETKNLGQQYLKRAYDLATESDSYYLTVKYCTLLQLVLDYYIREIDKAGIVQELVEITPNVYGSDKRRSRIYRGLQRYFSANNDTREMIVCYELLCCEYNYNGVKCYYDSCMKYHNPEIFLEKLNLIHLEKGVLSEDELLSLSEFIEINRSEMDANLVQSLEVIQKRMKSAREQVSLNKTEYRNFECVKKSL